MTGEEPPPDFAPVDLTDGREKGDWQSRYREDAPRWWIKMEAIYLALHLVGVPAILAVLYCTHVLSFICEGAEACDRLLRYSSAWLGGTLGGTLFSLKWLYHSVAKQRWHLDRRLWRFLTPHLSGGLAFAFVLLISSGVVGIFSRESMARKEVAFSLAFLVGYFSDTALAKLAEVAQTIFGPVRPTDRP